MEHSGLVFVVGVTNSGKTTLMQAAKDNPYAAAVEVGKIMRAKYSPDYFKGQGAPAHTENEACQIMIDGIEERKKAGYKAIFVDGQPRTLKQYEFLKQAYIDRYRCMFLHLYAPPDILRARAQARDPEGSPALELSLARLNDDPPKVYGLVSLIHSQYPRLMRTVDTSAGSYFAPELVASIVHTFNHTVPL